MGAREGIVDGAWEELGVVYLDETVEDTALAAAIGALPLRFLAMVKDESVCRNDVLGS